MTNCLVSFIGLFVTVLKLISPMATLLTEENWCFGPSLATIDLTKRTIFLGGGVVGVLTLSEITIHFTGNFSSGQGGLLATSTSLNAAETCLCPAMDLRRLNAPL